MKWLLPLVVIVILLIGCENKSVHGGTEGFITQFVSDDKVLIGDTIYEINRDTQIQTTDGDALKKNDLKIGMKVQPFYKDTLKETFPARGDAKLLRVSVDDESQKESVMMINVLHQLKHNEDEHFIITNVVHEDGVYEMDVMRRSNVDIGFTITVHDQTYEILYMEA
ncbi:hypothetical protein [Bacillus massiliigorillae]|uniref:hypothetical protein n=1 Tax=Bacillus massiliigorillae TaxID=1243664 RepID=UPI00039E49D2|nr:hypothetical protein [Bacillus massiliigorillae]